MCDVASERSFYLVNRDKGTVQEIGDFSDLISYLANTLDRGAAPYRKYDFSGGDRGVVEVWGWKRVRIPSMNEEGEIVWKDDYRRTHWEEERIKPLMVLDQSGAIVDIRQFEDEVRKEQNKISVPAWKIYYDGETAGEQLWVPQYIFSLHARCDIPYRFRRGAVPFIHKRNYWNYTPSSHRVQNLKMADQLRPKTRVDKSDLWDMPYRHVDRSWKSSFKVRHQWQKHIKR